VVGPLLLLAAGAALGAGAVLLLGTGPAPSGGSPATPPRAPGALPVPAAPSGRSDGTASGSPAAGLLSARAEDRRAALRALQKTPDPGARDDLLRLLDSETDPGIKMLAYAALGLLKDPSLVAILERRFETETDRRFRYAALEALGAIGGPEAERYLLALMEAPDESQDGILFRDAAARGLARSERPEAMEALSGFLRGGTLSAVDDPQRPAREFLLRELGQEGGPARVAVLLAVAGDPAVSADLRAESIRALENVEGPEGTEALRHLLDAALAASPPAPGEEDFRIAAVEALGGREDEGSRALLVPLASGARAVAEDVRREAVEALGRHPGPESTTVLLAVARDTAVPRKVRDSAWMAYGHAGGESAVPALEETALRGPDLSARLTAVRALGLAPATVRRPALERVAAASEDEKVRNLARAMLR